MRRGNNCTGTDRRNRIDSEYCLGDPSEILSVVRGSGEALSTCVDQIGARGVRIQDDATRGYGA